MIFTKEVPTEPVYSFPRTRFDQRKRFSVLTHGRGVNFRGLPAIHEVLRSIIAVNHATGPCDTTWAL